jgi:drug/metabolite transporter (DMT)-like permease
MRTRASPERASAVGGLCAAATGVAWGGQFVVGKSALASVNAFPLTTIRYAVAASLWLAVLWFVEGRGALRLGGRARRLLWLGTLGFAAFNLLAYTGLAHAQPQSASLIVALAPLLTALVLWRRTRVLPRTRTFVLLGIALAGVSLVISHGHPTSIFSGAIGWGDGLVLAGVFSFVLYGLGAAELPEFSALRYTALTAALGWLALAAISAVATGSGLVPLPSFDQLWSVSPQIAYLAIPGAFLAVLFWNAAIGMIGAQNAVLFGNLIPITTFAIEIGRGYRPGAVEIAGAALTIAAVIANNLLTRRPQAIDAADQARGRDTELAETARARANASPRAS